MATANELQSLCRPLSLQRRPSLSDFPLYEGRYADRSLLVVQTGLGPSRAARAAARLIGESGCEGIISLGLSGALAALVSGSLVLGTEWMILSGMPPERRGPGQCADHLLLDAARQAARRCGASIAEGRLLTTDRLAGDRRAKSTLAAETGAVAIDMESGAIAEVARTRAVPFLAMRAILDDMDTPLLLSPEQFLHVDGSLSWWRSGRTMAMHPLRIASYLAIGRLSGRAMTRLTQWLCCLLDEAGLDSFSVRKGGDVDAARAGGS